MTDANPDTLLLETRRLDPSSPLPLMHQAMRIALYDEYRARATYQKVVDAFGQVPPFSNIVGAEDRHVTRLEALFAVHNASMVIDDWPHKVVISPVFVENCEAGVAAEIENIAMYDALLPYADAPDVREAFYRLQAASYNNHLPAFRRCVASNAQPAPETTTGTNNEELMGQIAGMMNGGKVDPSKLTGLFQNLGGEFLTGALAGGVLGALLGGNLFSQNDDETQTTTNKE